MLKWRPQLSAHLACGVPSSCPHCSPSMPWLFSLHPPGQGPPSLPSVASPGRGLSLGSTFLPPIRSLPELPWSEGHLLSLYRSGRCRMQNQRVPEPRLLAYTCPLAPSPLPQTAPSCHLFETGSDPSDILDTCVSQSCKPLIIPAGCWGSSPITWAGWGQKVPWRSLCGASQKYCSAFILKLRLQALGLAISSFRQTLEKKTLCWRAHCFPGPE